jgi:hypothetical protein
MVGNMPVNVQTWLKFAVVPVWQAWRSMTDSSPLAIRSNNRGDFVKTQEPSYQNDLKIIMYRQGPGYQTGLLLLDNDARAAGFASDFNCSGGIA